MKNRDALSPQIRVSTGIGNVDRMLRGGFESGIFNLIYGGANAHITSLLLSVSVLSQLPRSNKGAGSKVVFVDAQNSFNPYAVSCMAASAGLDPEEVLKGIFVSRAFTSGQVEELILTKTEEEIDRVGAQVLIVSGLTTLHLTDGLREPNQEPLTKLLEIYGQLRRLGFQKNLVVVASSRLAENSEYKPAGGRALSHYAQILLLVRNRLRFVEYVLMKHPSIPERRTLIWKGRRKIYTPTLDSYFLDMS